MLLIIILLLMSYNCYRNNLRVKKKMKRNPLEVKVVPLEIKQEGDKTKRKLMTSYGTITECQKALKKLIAILTQNLLYFSQNYNRQHKKLFQELKREKGQKNGHTTLTQKTPQACKKKRPVLNYKNICYAYILCAIFWWLKCWLYTVYK